MKEVNKHEGTYNKNNIRDFMDLYIQTTRDSNCNMYRVIIELFLAGSDTTCKTGSDTTYKTLNFGLPVHGRVSGDTEQVLARMKVCLGKQKILYADRGKLTCIDSILTEIQQTLVPFSLRPRQCVGEPLARN